MGGGGGDVTGLRSDLMREASLMPQDNVVAAAAATEVERAEGGVAGSHVAAFQKIAGR